MKRKFIGAISSLIGEFLSLLLNQIWVDIAFVEDNTILKLKLLALWERERFIISRRRVEEAVVLPIPHPPRRWMARVGRVINNCSPVNAAIFRVCSSETTPPALFPKDVRRFCASISI